MSTGEPKAAADAVATAEGVRRAHDASARRLADATVLTTGFLVLALGGGARFAIGVTLQPMARDFAIGREMLGVIVAVYFVCTAVAMFVSGRAVDRFGARAVLAAGIVVSALGLGLTGLATAPWHVVVLFGIVFGVGNGLCSIAPVSILVTTRFPGRMGFASGLAISGMSVGQLVMVAAMAAVMVGIGWRAVYAWLGIAHLVLLPLLAMLPRADADAAPHKAVAAARPVPGLTLAQAAGTRRFWLLMAGQGLCGLDDFFVSTHVVAFAQDRGIDALLAGNLLALMGAASLAGVIWAGSWSDRSGPAWPMLANFVIRIGAFGLIVIDQSMLSILVFALAFGVTFLMTAPLTVVFARNWFGGRATGAIAGAVLMVHHTCGGLGAWVGGLVFDHDGNYAAAFAVMALSAVVGTILLLVMVREPRRVEFAAPTPVPAA